MSRVSFREKILRVREDAIVDAVNRLLAEKGFDLMTVDEVAAEVGIAKASLYKHFPSKEALAAAAMVRLLEQAWATLEQFRSQTQVSAGEKLKAVVRWCLEKLIAGEMPSLPSQNSTLRSELMGNPRYLDLLMQVSDRLGEWITQAQADGVIEPRLPPEVVLYTIYARACDPVPGVMKASGQYDDQQIVDWVMTTCFGGLSRRTD